MIKTDDKTVREIYDTMLEDRKESMISGDINKRNLVRLIIGDFENSTELDQDQARKLLNGHLDDTKEAMELVDDKEDYMARIEVIKNYLDILPSMLTRDELEEMVDQVLGNIEDANMSDFGKIMGQVMGRSKGLADGNLVKEIVQEKLK